MTSNKILIYFPSRRFGGSEILFVEFFYYLTKEGHEVLFVDYADGVCKQKIKQELKPLVISRENLVDFDFDSWTLIGSTSHFMEICNTHMRGNIKVLLLVLHKFHLLNLFSFSRIYKQTANSKNKFFEFFKFFEYSNWSEKSILINKLINKNSFVYFNKTTLDLHKTFFNFNKKIKIIDLPFKSSNNLIKKIKKNLNNQLVINFAWVSRLDSDLFDSIKKIIFFIDNTYLKNHEFILHIVGNGKYKDRISKIKSKNLKVVIVGPLFGINLYNYLHRYIDIGIGRGTVNLDFSSCRIPSILTSLPLKKKMEVKQFILGYEKLDNHSGKMNFHEILKFLINNYEKSQHLSLFNLKRHDSDIIYNKIYHQSIKCSSQISDFKGARQDNFLFYLKKIIKRCLKY